MKSIFFNGKFYVERGHFEEAVFIEDGLFKAVGKNEEILAMADADIEKIDCQGKTVIPGLNDSHQHLLLYAMNRNEVYTEDVTSVENLIEVCKKFMEENPEKYFTYKFVNDTVRITNIKKFNTPFLKILK